VKDKAAAQAEPAVQQAVAAVAEELGDTGRILVRESGTEPLIRVMVEAKSEELCRSLAQRVVAVIHETGHAQN
jgi:phosphoglucosamine mutase